MPLDVIAFLLFCVVAPGAVLWALREALRGQE